MLIDLEKDSWPGNSFKRHVRLTMKRDAAIHGVVAWFSADLGEGVVLSTSPADEVTHWHQTMFSFKEPIVASVDDEITGSIEFSPQPSNHRALSIVIELSSDNAEPPSQRRFYLD